MKKNKITLLNVISGLMLQVVTFINGFIIPKILLSYFGSEINGLVSSITQAFSYVSLLEGGISGVIIASLYKPIIENDNKKISEIIKTSKNFYKKIAIIFLLITSVIIFIYPFAIESSYTYIYIVSLAIIMSINLFTQYMFAIAYKNLLVASKKSFVISFTQIIIIILNLILTIVSIKIYPSVHIIKGINALLYLISPLIFNHYAKQKFDIDDDAKPDKKLIGSRWDGFAVNIAAFIHYSTDMVVLSLFTNLKVVSIYSVYALVTNGLRMIVNSISGSITPVIGQAYFSKDKKDFDLKFDVFEYITFILVFFLFTIGGLLITPFVMIYTNNISDVNYYEPLFGVLLIISEIIYLVKMPHLELSYCANKFKEITPISYLEAFLNIILSILFVKKFGLVGVVIGTIIGMTVRMIYQIWFTQKIVPDRKRSIFYSKLIIFIITSCLGIALCLLLAPNVSYNISSWIIHGIIYSVIMGVLYLICSTLFFRKELKFIKHYLIK